VGASLIFCCTHAKDPGEHRGSERHGQIGEVESPEAVCADADVDEIDDSARGAEAVEQVADGAPANERDRSDLKPVCTRSLPVHVGQNEERSEGQEHEPPPGRCPERKAHRAFGVVRESEAQHIVDDVVRKVGGGQRGDGESFARDIEEDGREEDRPESIGSLRHESL